MNERTVSEKLAPALSLGQVLILLAGMAAGAWFAVQVLPVWAPGLAASAAGESPKVYWYLSRSSAVTAYLLLWLSMLLGVLMTNRLARIWPGGPLAYDLHQYASLLGLGFAVFHALVLLGDEYLAPTLGQVLVPFGMDSYQPLWTGAGQVAFYLFGLVAFSFYVRRRTGLVFWRILHGISYLVYLLVLGHGILSGSDAGRTGVAVLYWTTAGSLLFFTIYRIFSMALPDRRVVHSPDR